MIRSKMLPALPMKSAYMRHCFGSSSKRSPNRPPMNNRPRDPMPSFETHLIAAAEAAAAVPVKEPAPTAHAKLTA